MQKIIMNIRDTKFDVDGQWLFKNNALSSFGKRLVDKLLKRSGDLYRENEHLRRFNEIIGDGNDVFTRRET